MFGNGFTMWQRALLGGPGIVPAIVLPIIANLGGFYSVVRLSTWNGNCCRVQRSSDGTQQDIGFRNNVLDYASALAFANGSTLTVAKWYDQSGNGADLSQATTANQPSLGTAVAWRNIPAISIDGTSQQTASQKWLQTTLTANRNALTVYQVGTFSSYGNVVQYEFTDGTFATKYAQGYTNNAPFGVNYGSAISSGILGRTNIGVVGVSASGTNGIIVRHHGTEYDNATNPTSQALGGLVIGKSLSGSTYNGAHNLWGFAWYTAAHTSAQMQSIEGVLNTAFSTPSGFTKRLIYGGSSLVTSAYSVQMQNPPFLGGFTNATDWEVFNTAVYGRTLATEFSNRTDYDNLYDATKLKNVCIIDAPSNDIATASYASQAAAITAGQSLYSTTTASFVSNLKTHNITPIVPTIIARQGFQTGTGNFYEDARLAYNTAAVAGGVTNGHAVSDRASDSRLSDPTNMTYFYTDGIHLALPGRIALAGIDQAKVLAA